MDGIIFDIDGTLWNTTPVVADAWTHYLKDEEKLDITITAEDLTHLFGQLLPDIAKQIFPDKSEKEQLRLIDLCCQREHEAILATDQKLLYDGIPFVFRELSKEYPLFIVSNCEAGYIEVFLKKTGLSSFVTDHLCPGDTGFAKASNIREIVTRHHLTAPVYVGDTHGDYLACQEAGVSFIHAAYGFGEVPEALHHIHEPAELIQLIKEPD
ncbi:MAG: HAD family hydrolase [Blautia sp.]|nr:HAD family hydrolase [Blautia sp.]